MLLSLVLALTPTHPFRPSGFYGRQARAWFLGQVARHDPDFAAELHQLQGPRPYTVSSIRFPGEHSHNGRGPVRPGDLCFLRVTSLDAHLSNLMLTVFLPDLPPTVTIKGVTFEPVGRVDWHEWDCFSDYHELFWGITEMSVSSRVTLDIASPTAFRSQGIDLTLPTPDQVWRGLYWRWQSHAPEELRINSLWAPFSAKGIVVSDFKLRSGKVIFKDGTKGIATGCTGRITYRLLAAKHCRELAAFRPEAEQIFHLLARFAIFTGLGHHTTVGMGQVRCVSHGQGGQDGKMINSRYHYIEMG